MKKQIILKILLLFALVTAFRLIHGQTGLDTIDWAYHQKQGCTAIKEKIANIDTTATAFTMIESSRCALRLLDGQLALKYIALAESKGFKNTVMIDILKSRSHAMLNEDEKALSILRDLSTKIELIRVMEIPEIKNLSMRNAEVMSIYHNSKPAFDFFTFVIAAICFLGFFAGILFFIKSLKIFTLRWLSLYVINFTIIMTSYVLYWTKFNWYFPYLNEWWHALYLLIGPLFYFYIKSISGEKISGIRMFLHFFPFIFCVGIFTFYGIFSFIPNSLKSNLILFIFQGMPIKLVSLSSYFALSLYQTKEDWMIDLYVKKWIQLIFGFFGVFILANFMYYLCTFWEGFNREWDYGISAIMSAGIIGVAAMGFMEAKYLSFQHVYILDVKQKQPSQDTNKEMAPIVPDLGHKKYRTSSLTSSASISVKTKLEKLMSEQKIYQREDLRMQDVADLIGLHRNHVSQVINENYNLNFFEWVNRYRIHHAADLLSTPNCPYTISEVGFDAGFNNKVTFYKTFRQYFQCTPMEYIARLETQRAKMS